MKQRKEGVYYDGKFHDITGNHGKGNGRNLCSLPDHYGSCLDYEPDEREKIVLYERKK